MTTSYLGELRTNWRYASAAAVGMGFGYSLFFYAGSVFSTPLVAEFGWSKAQFALLGTILIINVICLPVVGRLTDIFGVRRVVLFGITAGPLVFAGLSMIGGSFAIFLALNYVLAIVHGTTTSSTVFGRLIAQRFEKARGLALSIMAGTPAIAAAIAVPLLTMTIDNVSWRAAYLALGAIALVSGIVTLMLIPRDYDRDRESTHKVGSARADYPVIMRTRTFQIILVAMLFCNLTTMVFLSQIKLILGDRNVDPDVITTMVSVYVTGMLVGRLGCGLALDRFPAHIVSAICMALPAIGIFMLASGITDTLLLFLAVSTVGMALGAELDIGGYLVMRFFRRELYGTVYSISSSMIGVSGAIGSVLLSFTLKLTGDYDLYLVISGVALLIGAALFLSLGRYPAVHQDAQPT